MQTNALHRIRSGPWSPDADLAEAAVNRRRRGTVVWVEADVSNATPAAVKDLAEEFDLDPLAVEDALNPRQRPKLEHYPGHVFVVMHQLDEVDEQLEQRQIACFAGTDFLLVLHCGAERLVEEARSRAEAIQEEAAGDRLLHPLLDAVVDDYEAIAERLEVDVEELESAALRVSRTATISARSVTEMPSQVLLYTLKQQVSVMRRFALPLTGVVQRMQDDHEGEERELFRDVQDHLIRIGAQVRSVEDLADAVLDLTRGVQADVLNEINKKLTAWAAIIAVPTFIASIYGTNYTLLPSPKLGAIGFVYVLAIMAGAAAGLWLFFKRRRWI